VLLCSLHRVRNELVNKLTEATLMASTLKSQIKYVCDSLLYSIHSVDCNVSSSFHFSYAVNCDSCPRNDLLCVEWDVKPCSHSVHRDRLFAHVIF